MNDDYYQDTAFNSRTAELQRPWDNTTFDIRLAGRRQPWLKVYSRRLPMKFVEDWLLNKASFIKVQHLMNHESFNFITTKGGWALLHTWMKIFFLFSSFFFIPLIGTMAIYVYAADGKDVTILITLGGWVDLFVFSVQFFLVNILLLWAVKKTKPLAMSNFVKGYKTILRRTGEVEFWNNKKRIKQDIKNFDSYSIHRRDRYMISSFEHDIRNRYSGKSIGVTFSTIECHASNFIEWEFIRQYMDISQPLPDIPQLEYCRHLDPVTAEYDKKGKRRLPSGQKCPADFWRKMDKATFEKKYRKMFENAGKDINWQNKRCILTGKLGTEI